MNKAYMLLGVLLGHTVCEGATFTRGLQNQWYGISGVADTVLPIASYTVNAAVVDQQNRTYLVGIKTGVGSLVIRLTSTGFLDTNYGNGRGYVTFKAVGVTEQLYGAALDGAGNLYVCGGNGTSSFAAKLLPSGLLDISWGDSSGLALDELATYDYAYALAIQENGNLTVCGQASTTYFFLVRLLSSGAVDPSFNNGTRFRGNSSFINARALALQSDGKIVVIVDDGTNGKVYRFSSSGILDATFSDGAGFLSLAGVTLYSLYIQSSGRIIVGGQHADGGNRYIYMYGIASDGLVDASFGSSGIASFNLVGVAPLLPKSIVSDVYGRLLVGINSNSTTSYIGALSQNGVIDSSFVNELGLLEVAVPYQGFTQDYRGNLVLAYKGDVNQCVSLYTNYSSSAIGLSLSSGPRLITTGVVNRFEVLKAPLYRAIISSSQQACMNQQELSFNSGL